MFLASTILIIAIWHMCRSQVVRVAFNATFGVAWAFPPPFLYVLASVLVLIPLLNVMHLAGMRGGWGGGDADWHFAGFFWNFVAGSSCGVAVLLSSFGAAKK